MKNTKPNNNNHMLYDEDNCATKEKENGLVYYYRYGKDRPEQAIFVKVEYDGTCDKRRRL